MGGSVGTCNLALTENPGGSERMPVREAPLRLSSRPLSGAGVGVVRVCVATAGVVQKRNKEALQTISVTFDRLIAKSKAVWETEDEEFDEEVFLSQRDPSILHFLIASGDDITSKQLRDDLMTMLIAGHETTAAVLTWTTYLLTQHPDEQAKVQAEVRRAGPHTVRPFRFHDPRVYFRCCVAAHTREFLLWPPEEPRFSIAVVCCCFKLFCPSNTGPAAAAATPGVLGGCNADPRTRPVSVQHVERAVQCGPVCL